MVDQERQASTEIESEVTQALSLWEREIDERSIGELARVIVGFVQSRGAEPLLPVRLLDQLSHEGLPWLRGYPLRLSSDLRLARLVTSCRTS